MRRRDFIALLSSAAAGWPFAATAQQSDRIPRIGYLSLLSEYDNSDLRDAFRVGLRDLGYIEGKNLNIEFRFANGREDRLAELVSELIELHVDVIVTAAAGVYVAHQVTTTVPIVMASAGDVVAMGIVPSLAHPGGNVTGSNFFLPELMAKRLELLKQVAPSQTRAGVLLLRDVQSRRNVLDAMGEVAKALRMDLWPIEVDGPSEFESAFSTWSNRQIGEVVIWDIFAQQVAAIAPLTAKYRFVSIGPIEPARNGGLIGYGVNFPQMWRHAAYFVDKILKGAKPGDIPIEQATKFTTIVNLKAAKALGIDIPPTLLAAADEVIE